MCTNASVLVHMILSLVIIEGTTDYMNTFLSNDGFNSLPIKLHFQKKRTNRSLLMNIMLAHRRIQHCHFFF